MEVTVALGPELRIRRFNKIVKYGAKKDVSFVYRPDPAYDGSKFKKVTPKRLVKAVQRAKQQFQKLYGLKLTHVFFPYTKGYHCKKQVAAVEAAGFKVFGHNLYVDRKLGDAAKDDLKDDLRKLSKKHKGIIVYEEAHNAHLVKDLLYVEKLLKKKKYEVVGIEQCLKNGGSSEDDSEDDDGTANEANNGEMAPALQAPENPETPAESESSEKKNSASALSVSFVSIAVASVLLLAL